MRRLDPQSLGEHLDGLYRAAWALCGSPADAEDLVQETFARVLSRPRFLRGDSDRAYLMRVLQNTFYSAGRAASRRPKTTVSLDDIQVVEPRASVQPERALETREIFAAIAALPDDFRLALVAVDVLGLSYREAGQALGVGEATITSRLFRARQRIARTWSAEPDPRPAGAEALSVDRALPKGREGTTPQTSPAK